MIEIDTALIDAAKSGDRDSKDKIISLFKKRIESYANRYYLAGGERSDLVQEGFLGIARALEQFEQEKGNFAAFALACANNQMKNSVKKNRTLKNKALNESVPFDAVNMDENFSDDDSPETIYLIKESNDTVLKLINEKLTPAERETALLFAEGFGYNEIAEQTGKDTKSVGNALTRARKKLSAALKEIGG